jgi:hypothetical protein
MTTLTNAARDSAIADILQDAFDPRFDALEKKLRAEYCAEMKEQHPAFYKAWKDPETKKYLYCTHNPDLYRVDEGSHIALCRPVYGRNPGICTSRYPDRDAGYAKIVLKDEVGPVSTGPVSTGLNLEDGSALLAEYRAIWADYGAAFVKIQSLLYTYKVREKFEVDFPSLKKYLPPLPPTKVNLPMPVASKVMEDLAKFGIPAGE